MRLSLALTTDDGKLISQRDVLNLPDEDLSLCVELLTKLDESLRLHAATIQAEKHGDN